MIGVRSCAHRPSGAGTPGRIYTLLSIQQISAWQTLVHPVDVNALLHHVRQSLEGQGFQAAKARQAPDIVLTVQYGRDLLENPYLGGHGEPPPISGIASATAINEGGTALEQLPNQTIAGTPVQLMNRISPGAEARTQKAGYEKLYLRITAWQYPFDPKARPKQLWTTTMAVDDPDRADLNVLAVGCWPLAPLILAGAPHNLNSKFPNPCRMAA